MPAPPDVQAADGTVPDACRPGLQQPGHAPVAPASQHQPLLGLRTALILAIAVAAAAAAGVLTYRAEHSTAAALLAGGGTFAGTVLFLNTIIGS
ncbi:hypothetical protein ACFYWU_33885 [Streptomyces chrestomyceticus]|uniref:hypothetical protein n=1 Tax=Streptomyces chrestomyceticus TaxID=68185 RepID=UPI003409C64B